MSGFDVGHRVVVHCDRDVGDLNGYFGHVTRANDSSELVWVNLIGRVGKVDERILGWNPWPFWPGDIVHAD